MTLRPTRRMIALGLPALALAGCSTGIGGIAPPARSANEWRTVPNADFDAWLAGFRTRAVASGISGPTVTRASREMGYVPLVIERDRNQAEFNRTMEDYLAIAASDERISLGRQRLRQHGGTLDGIEAEYGVPGNVVAAIWGMETFYGTRMGDAPTLAAMATLTFDGRRERFFNAQLLSALRTLDRGDAQLGDMYGSWAGAMGHTQVMPEVLEEYGVDFNRDGRKGAWEYDPTDALATTANYLRRYGWQRGRPWGMEVQVPDGFDAGLAGRGNGRSVAAWNAAGVRDMDGGPVPDHGEAALLLPMGVNGPGIMAFRNFFAIRRYNPADNYVIGIGHLSDRLVGGPPIRGTYPPDEYGLPRAGRQEVQRLLTRAGYDTGGVDGVIGPASQSAIRDYQRANGLGVDGIASAALLTHLRG